MTSEPSADYRALVDRLELRSIVMTECSAARSNPEVPTDSRLEVQTGYRTGTDQIDYRFEFRCDPLAGDTEVATIRVVLVSEYGLAEGDAPGDPDVLQFAEDVALMAAFPYAREAIQSLASRLEIPGFTLGLIRRGQIHLAEAEPSSR